MEETARTLADAGGRFSFRLPDSGPHLIRAIHQGVTYHRMALPGTDSVEVQVFDVSPSVADISVTADVMRFQAKGEELQGTRLFSVNNASNPPRTQTHGKDFAFFLPDGAQIDQGMAMTAGGEPIKLPPVAGKEKNQYGFVFPLRPGETQFQVAFHMRYAGQLDIDPKEHYGAQHFVVMVPATMQFIAVPGVTFQSMADPRQSDALVRVVSNTRAGQPLSFRISGTGTLSEPGDDSQGAPHPIEDQNDAVPAASSSDRDSGKEQNTPTGVSGSLTRYRWYLLTGLALLLAAGTIYTKTRFRATTDLRPNRPGSARTSNAAIASSRSAALLAELKNELFKLEVDHKQGRISGSEYERARAALDQTLKQTIKQAPQD
jgi:hypothetical protein